MPGLPPPLLALTEPPLPNARGDGHGGADPGRISLFCWGRQHRDDGLGTRQALMDKEDLATGVLRGDGPPSMTGVDGTDQGWCGLCWDAP